MKEPLARHKVQIMEITPARYGDSEIYCTKIKFAFDEGKIPFLIKPQWLTRRFWTGPGNSKSKRSVEYRWPSKCRLCSSETHLTARCPWPGIEVESRRPNFFNCRFHDPGWTEMPKKVKIGQLGTMSEISDLRPRQARADLNKGKGKGRAMNVDPYEPQPN